MSHQPQLQTQPNSSSAKSDKIDSASDMKESLQKSSDSSDHSAKRTSDRTVDSAGSRDSTSSSSRKSRSSNSRYQDAQLQITHKNPKQQDSGESGGVHFNHHRHYTGDDQNFFSQEPGVFGGRSGASSEMQQKQQPQGQRQVQPLTRFFSRQLVL